jgi:2-phosphosulfolactate phosphatase
VSPGRDSADAAEFRRQDGSAFRFDWGEDGLRALGPTSDVVVIVDVLRFSTSVSAAIEAGATVVPARDADEAATIARERGLLLAGPRGEGPASLSPTDLLCLGPGSRVVLASLDGSSLSCLAVDIGVRYVLAGSFRNAAATASAAAERAGAAGVISVIAAGERCPGDGTVRAAVEDLLGAGAVLAALDPAAAVSGRRCSPEAAAARAAFVAARPQLFDSLSRCESGRELEARRCGDDVAMAAACDVTSWAAVLEGGAFVARSPGRLTG